MYWMLILNHKHKFSYNLLHNDFYSGVHRVLKLYKACVGDYEKNSHVINLENSKVSLLLDKENKGMHSDDMLDSKLM